MEVTYERGGGGAKSDDSEKAWPSINNSKFSGWDIRGGNVIVYDTVPVNVNTT